MLRITHDSPLAGSIFKSDPTLNGAEVIVLQVMNLDEDWMLVELISRDEYNPTTA